MPPKWKEKLPENCPPNDAEELSRRQAVRFVYSSQPTWEDFKSKAALGLPQGDADDCCHASCSMFCYDDEGAGGMRLTKLPKMRPRKYIAILDLNRNAGRAKVKSSSGHIDLWMYESFDPIKAIQKVMRRDEIATKNR